MGNGYFYSIDHCTGLVFHVTGLREGMKSTIRQHLKKTKHFAKSEIESKYEILDHTCTVLTVHQKVKTTNSENLMGNH
ncbi:Hypothetical predicted protein [Octopus vulgaris]|uniref:Uncharacterized protein n=1 Tax=Octopus vulgaris TaxID=6645 RepID=A0AA36B4E5_OCTVU|nr:Hypothetical predicted protein [Octopus vulgaris]